MNKKEAKLVGWPGAKTHLMKELLPIINAIPHKGFVEAFCGSAIVTLMKRPSLYEIINDKHSGLINLFYVVKYKEKELLERLRLTLGSEAMYKQFNHPDKLRPKEMGDVGAAFRFIYCNRQAFGHRLGDQWTLPMHSPNYIVSRLVGQVSKIHLRLEKVVVCCRDYKNLPTSLDKLDTLWYCDPPYRDSTTKGYAGVIDYEEFFEWVNSLKGSVVVSHQQDRAIERLFADWEVNVLGARPNFLQGGKGSGKTRTKELLFTNFELPNVRKGLI